MLPVMSFTTTTPPPAVGYPDSDGRPMADNSLQFEWIVTLQGNLDLMFRETRDVFVAGDHLIYPVEDNADIRQAPDVYVAFGRPKGHRGSYRLFAEDNIFPQVIFEVWSPGNTAERMEEKRKFYERYGAEEYYVLFPDFPAYCRGWRRARAGRKHDRLYQSAARHPVRGRPRARRGVPTGRHTVSQFCGTRCATTKHGRTTLSRAAADRGRTATGRAPGGAALRTRRRSGRGLRARPRGHRASALLP